MILFDRYAIFASEIRKERHNAMSRKLEKEIDERVHYIIGENCIPLKLIVPLYEYNTVIVNAFTRQSL
jgi:hypothetical protein